MAGQTRKAGVWGGGHGEQEAGERKNGREREKEKEKERKRGGVIFSEQDCENRSMSRNLLGGRERRSQKWGAWGAGCPPLMVA